MPYAVFNPEELIGEFSAFTISLSNLRRSGIILIKNNPFCQDYYGYIVSLFMMDEKNLEDFLQKTKLAQV